MLPVMRYVAPHPTKEGWSETQTPEPLSLEDNSDGFLMFLSRNQYEDIWDSHRQWLNDSPTNFGWQSVKFEAPSWCVMESVQKKPFAVSFCSLAIFSLTYSYFLRGFPAFFIYEELSCWCFVWTWHGKRPRIPIISIFLAQKWGTKKTVPCRTGRKIPHRAL